MPKIYVGRGNALLFEHYHTLFEQSKEKILYIIMLWHTLNTTF
jgi:hypothetical protein